MMLITKTAASWMAGTVLGPVAFDIKQSIAACVSVHLSVLLCLQSKPIGVGTGFVFVWVFFAF